MLAGVVAAGDERSKGGEHRARRSSASSRTRSTASASPASSWPPGRGAPVGGAAPAPGRAYHAAPCPRRRRLRASRPDRRLRLRRRRAHRPARAARLAAARGLPLPRRHRALPVRRAHARPSSSASRCEIAEALLARARQAARRRLQLGDGGGAAGAARGGCWRRRSASTSSASSGPEARAGRRDDAQRPDRPARDAGDGRQRRLRARRRTPPTRTSTSSRSPCPDLAPIIQARLPVRPSDVVDDRARATCAPLREAGVDTVILGCTHYPLVRPMLQRMLGRGVDDRHLGRGARAAGRARARRRAALGNAARDGEGDYRFLCTGDAEAFRALGTRFLQLPLGDGRARRRSRARGRRMSRARPSAPTSAPPTSCARSTIEPGFVRTATGLGAHRAGRDARDLHGVGRGGRAALDGRPAAAAGSRPSTGCCPRRPASASSATSREGRPDGRTVEIQRLIGRSLRGVVDFEALGERTIYLDCDVLQADGGTRCASITGAYVALALALRAAHRRAARSSARR